MTVLQIDTTVSPPTSTIIAVGGGVSGPATGRNAQSAESIDLTSVGPAASWTRLPDLHFARTNVNVVLLPDGTLLVIGGQRNGKWASDPGAVLEAEIFDPRTGVWTPTAPMAFPRQYHSIAVLIPDGRVLSTGGVDPSPGAPLRDQRSMEVFSPGLPVHGYPPSRDQRACEHALRCHLRHRHTGCRQHRQRRPLASRLGHPSHRRRPALHPDSH
jgi:hypothetical protein